MKKIIKLLAAFVAMATVVACEPVEDRDNLPAKGLEASQIAITVTHDAVNQNLVTMQNNTPGITPYWSYVDSKGNEIGHSNQNNVEVMFPFAGTYKIQFTAFTRGGGVEAAPVTVTINENNEASFSDPKWDLLTNGTAGKTWVLDMESPIGWAGFKYPENTADPDGWNWFPDYAGNSWVMPNKNWGEMTFDLNGAYNVNVIQTALEDDTQTNRSGSFSFNIAANTMSFNGAAELLHGGDYYLDASNWRSLKVVELTEGSLRLSVVRDQSRKAEDPCQIVFHFKPKQQ